MRKISRGAGFRGALNYIFDRNDDENPGIFIGGNMSGTTPLELSKEFSLSRQLRPTIRKPVWHNSLRLPLGDKISHETWRTVVGDYMREMGFNELHQRVVVLHDDEKGQHVHILASRIDLIGKLWLGRNENLESTRIISMLEERHGLSITKGVNRDYNEKIMMPDLKAMKKGELEKALATALKPSRVILQEYIIEALDGYPTLSNFMSFLENRGVVLHPNIASSGRMNGFSFEHEGMVFSGSALGKKFKWSSLLKVIDYEQDRDSEKLAGRRRASGKLSDARVEFVQTTHSPRADLHISESFFSGDVESNERSTVGCRTSDRGIEFYNKFIQTGFNLRQSESQSIARASDDTAREITCVDGFNKSPPRSTRNNGEKRMPEFLASYTHKNAKSINKIEQATANAYQTIRNDILESIYGKSSDVITKYWRIDRSSSDSTIFLNRTGRIVDRGKTLECQNGNKYEIEVMLKLARLKSWKIIVIHGSDSFRYRAMKAALLANFDVGTSTESDKILLQKVKSDLRQSSELLNFDEIDAFGVTTQESSLVSDERNAKHTRKIGR